MVLVDTSVWIDYLRGKPHAASLAKLLQEHQVMNHPWVTGEILLGYLGPRRSSILADLQYLPQLTVHEVDDLRDFVEKGGHVGQGLSLIDIQLLYAAIAGDCLLWTFDRALQKVAQGYGKSYG